MRDYRDRRFIGRLLQGNGKAGCGYITLEFQDKQGEDVFGGLRIFTYGGRKNADPALDRVGSSWVCVWTEPSEELLVIAFRCAMGFLPPEILADWLQDRESELIESMHQWREPDDSRTKSFAGVLAQLRRLAIPNSEEAVT